MEISRVIAVLKRHNQWRRGEDTPMTNPAELGEALGWAVRYLEMMKDDL